MTATSHTREPESCQFCGDRGCLACLTSRARAAKEIILTVRCTADEVDDIVEQLRPDLEKTAKLIILVTGDTIAPPPKRPPPPPEVDSVPPEIAQLLRDKAAWLSHKTPLGRSHVRRIEQQLATWKENIANLQALFDREQPKLQTRKRRTRHEDTPSSPQNDPTSES